MQTIEDIESSINIKKIPSWSELKKIIQKMNSTIEDIKSSNELKEATGLNNTEILKI